MIDLPVLSETTSLVTLTDAAIAKLKSVLESQPDAAGIRLGVVGGGCAGLQYRMEPCDLQAADDQMFEIAGIRFFVDPKSSLYLSGVRIDFSRDLLDGGFKFSNPNAKDACGCGTSFSI
ncbi:MAG: iron-sulfur cluster assembly accessory protein [Vampirovibrionales bacterium]|nr:iron-sulfur cluster assembly accessory protein [Vampirovibrionales bacterium]